MSIESRIYVSKAFAFGRQHAVDNVLQSHYTAVIVWSVHVDEHGNLYLNDTMFVSNGIYAEQKFMDIPSRVAQLHKAGRSIIFSVGAGETQDYTNIRDLMKKSAGPESILYKNFEALKKAIVDQNADIDAIDIDNEDCYEADVIIKFCLMLNEIGYKNVTFCPSNFSTYWQDAYKSLNKEKGDGFISAIHLQCYSGGMRSPKDWVDFIAPQKGKTMMIPGLATNQADPGPWWYQEPGEPAGKPGGSVVKTPGVAMYGQADWSNMLWKDNFPSAEAAMQATLGAETFFFYCNQPMNLGSGKEFQKGDAVFFGGRPWWGSAPQCDSYQLSGGCHDIYNGNGACPKDIHDTLSGWKKDGYTMHGAFIWFYDSIVQCVLSNCCDGKNKTTAQVAADYQKAIVKGLGG